MPDKFDSMNGPQLAEYYNSICQNKVKKFRSLEEGRERCRQVAPPEDMNQGEQAVTTKKSKKAPAQAEAATEVTLASTMKLRPGTNREKVVLALGPEAKSLKEIATAAYGDEKAVPRVRNVLREVEKAVSEWSLPYRLEVSKTDASLSQS